MAYKDVILKYLSHISSKEIAEFVGVNSEIVENLSEEIKDIRIADTCMRTLSFEQKKRFYMSNSSRK